MKESFSVDSVDVYRILNRTYNKIRRDLQDKLGENGITWPQFHALYHIGESEDGIAANELAKKLSCNASNMTGLIDRMIENNWVYREQSEHDRRVWYIKLTKKGMEFREKLIPEHHGNIKNRFSVLNDEELTTLRRILEKLLQSFE